MEEIILSIIVPVHNTGVYLERCVRSLINQTLKNIEIILIDDGSTDNSLDICNYYASKCNKIKVYSKEHSGPGASRNYGMTIAKGQYIGFVDSDDYIDENMYMSLVNSALDNDCEISVCNYEIVDSKSKVNKNKTKSKYNVLTGRKQILSYYFQSKISVYAWDKIYKREFLLSNGIRFPEKCFYEDINMILEVLSLSSKVVINDEKYYKYFQRDDSIMHTYTEKHLYDYIAQIKKYFDFIYNYCDTVSLHLEIKISRCRLTHNLLNIISELNQEYKVEKYFRQLPNKIIIFGASKGGELIKHYCDLFGNKILYYSDNDSKKWGSKLNGVEIIDPGTLRKITEQDYHIYISSMYYKEIYCQLVDYKLEDKICELNIF